ncbi:hypothetical protein HU200_064222 [Digitaria exilis]|uniref:Uncharacterized protein n=1 Tax=Digitaria exilis TaxID=1010633 RepID=A0A835A2C3_9POAL|nr:hypothetical protein HU200_064222 [Digitaria exilis]
METAVQYATCQIRERPAWIEANANSSYVATRHASRTSQRTGGEPRANLWTRARSAFGRCGLAQTYGGPEAVPRRSVSAAFFKSAGCLLPSCVNQTNPTPFPGLVLVRRDPGFPWPAPLAQAQWVLARPCLLVGWDWAAKTKPEKIRAGPSPPDDGLMTRADLARDNRVASRATLLPPPARSLTKPPLPNREQTNPTATWDQIPLAPLDSGVTRQHEVTTRPSRPPSNTSSLPPQQATPIHPSPTSGTHMAATSKPRSPSAADHHRFLRPGALARLRDARLRRASRLPAPSPSPPSPASPASPVPAAAAAGDGAVTAPYFVPVSRLLKPRCPQRKKLSAAKCTVLFPPPQPSTDLPVEEVIEFLSSPDMVVAAH